MAFCSKCGKELADGAMFCAGCGAPLGSAENEAKNFNAEEAAKAAGEKAKAAGGKVKGLLDKLPFNSMAAKIPALAKVAGYANYAACVLGVLLVAVVVAVATPDKGEKQATGSSDNTEKVAKTDNKKNKAKPSGKTDKALNGEWRRGETAVYSFDKGEFSYFYILDGTMSRGTYETDTRMLMGEEVGLISFTWNEDYNFETGKWIAREKSYESQLFYYFSDNDTLEALNDRADSFTYKRGKYLKELIAKETENAKERKKITAMSVDKLKKQKPAPESDFEVKPTDDSFTAITITKYKGKDPLVVIPATMQGLPVKRIGWEAFKGNSNLVAVVIPEGVTYVDGFSSCKNLSVAVLPSTLVAIDGAAFRFCSSLTSINLPEGLMYIGGSAFKGTGLTSVSLPKSLRLMGGGTDGAFNDCDSLAEIQIPEDHAISYIGHSSEEITFVAFFKGTKINESIALQKLLKETKTRKISWNEFESIGNDIAKKIGAKSLDSHGYIKW